MSETPYSDEGAGRESSRHVSTPVKKSESGSAESTPEREERDSVSSTFDTQKKTCAKKSDIDPTEGETREEAFDGEQSGGSPDVSGTRSPLSLIHI